MQAFPIVDVSPSLVQAHVVWLISLLWDGWCCPLPVAILIWIRVVCLHANQHTWMHLLFLTLGGCPMAYEQQKWKHTRKEEWLLR